MWLLQYGSTINKRRYNSLKKKKRQEKSAFLLLSRLKDFGKEAPLLEQNLAIYINIMSTSTRNFCILDQLNTPRTTVSSTKMEFALPQSYPREGNQPFEYRTHLYQHNEIQEQQLLQIPICRESILPHPSIAVV